MAAFYYVRPDEMFAINGAVSGGADTNYLDEWLVDGLAGRPVRAANGSPSWTISNPSKTTSLIAVCNHNVDAGRNIAITGGVTQSLTGPTVPPNGIPLNPWVTFAETGVSTLTVSIASNSVNVIIGELIAGKMRSLERSLRPGPQFAPSYGVVKHDADFNSLRPYDKAIKSRRLSGELLLTATGLADLEDWFDSTRGSTLPSLIVPIVTKQDAWLVDIVEFDYKAGPGVLYTVSIAFQEYPRSRW